MSEPSIFDTGRVHIYEMTGSDSFTQIGNSISGAELFGWVIDLSGDGKRIAVGRYHSYDFDLWNFDGAVWEQNVDTDVLPQSAFMTDICLSKDGTKVGLGSFTTGAKGESYFPDATLYGVENGNALTSPLFSDWEGGSIVISDDGQMLAIGNATLFCSDCVGRVRVFDITTDDPVQIGSDIVGISAGDRCGFSLDLSEDGRTIVIGCYTKALIATLNDDASDTRPNWTIERTIPFTTAISSNSGDPTRTVAISSDGKTFVSGSPMDGIVKVFKKDNEGNENGKNKKNGKRKKKGAKPKKKGVKGKPKNPKKKKGKGKSKRKKKMRILV